MAKPKVALTISRPMARRVFTPEDLDAARRDFDLVENPHETPLTVEQAKPLLAEVEAVLNSWTTPRFDEDLLSAAPRLRAIAYAAGSVKVFATDALWARNIAVSSAAAHIAVDVAHTAVGLMVAACKNLFEIVPMVSVGKWGAAWHQARFQPDDLRYAAVGVIGASNVGRQVVRLLQAFDVRVLLCDPFLDAAKARELGAEKVELPKLFSESDIVSCHAPKTDATLRMVNREMLGRMKPGAIFINTSRGALVDEAALVEFLKANRIRAVLDVTDPEPPPPDSPLYNCPNLAITPHIAGSTGRARQKLGGFAAEELRRFFRGEGFKYPVTRDMLDRMA